MQLPPCFSAQCPALPRSAFGSRVKKSASALLLAALALAPAAYATTYDANSLTIAASSGDGVTTITTTGASGGNIRVFNSNAIGDSITFSVSAASTAEYSLSVRFLNNPNRGTVRLSVNGVEQGALHDGYHPSGSFVTVDYGKVLLTAGTQQIKFAVTGHNSSSSDYRMGFDTLSLDALAARTDITTFSSITDALNSGVPLYAPPGTYALPSSYTPVANIDILGSTTPANQPVFQVQNPSLLQSNYSLRFQGIKFTGSAPGRKLLSIGTGTFTMANLTILDSSFTSCTPIVWAGFPAITGQLISRLEMRRFSISGANRGLYAAGRIDDYDVTDFTVDDCGRFGVYIGPEGKNLNATIKDLMKRGSVARGIITGTRIEDVTNAQLCLIGNNIVVEDMELYDMVLPSAYYTDPAKATEYPHDSEPFYTKIDNLTVKNLYVENDGAFQAMWSNKGASDPSDPGMHGSNATAKNLEFLNTGSRYCVGIWSQSNGDNLYEDVTITGRTRDAVIVHDAATGTLTIRNWIDVNPPSSVTYPGVKDKSLSVTPVLDNCPSLTVYVP